MSTLLRFLLGFVGGVAAFAVVAGLPFWPSASASYTPQLSPPERLADVHPNEGGTALYSLCTGGDPTTALVWAYGPEIWESRMGPGPFFGAMHFQGSSTVCDQASYIRAIFEWEYALSCPPEGIACEWPYLFYEHDDGTGFHKHVTLAVVVYDYQKYMGLRNNDWRGVVSAHEWGHAMSLADIGGLSICPNSQLLMAAALWDDRDVPCVLGPHFYELCSTMNAYGFDPDEDCLRNARESIYGSDPHNPDTDGDGCADSEEVAAAPPGQGRPGATGLYNPLAWYDFYDVPIPASDDPTPNGTRNRVVNMQDVVGLLKYVGTELNGPSNGRVDYDSDKNGDTVKDGVDYDRSPGPLPNPPYDAGPPSGAVNMQDVVMVLRQVGLTCSGPPPAGEVGAGGASASSGSAPSTAEGGMLSPAPNAMAVDAVPGGGVEPTRTVTGTAPFDVSVLITAAGSAHAGYDLTLSYDDQILAAGSWSYTGLGGMGLNATVARSDGDGDTLVDTATGGSASSSGTSTATGAVVMASFRCVGSGTSPLHLVAPAEAVLSTATIGEGGAAIETSLTDASVTCQGVQ